MSPLGPTAGRPVNIHSIKISMNGKGRAIDTIFMERLWRSVKYEEMYVNVYQSVEQLRNSLRFLSVLKLAP